MKQRALHLWLMLLFAASCFSCGKTRNQNEIRSIELMRIGSWSDSGAMLLIDSTLTFRYLDRNNKQNYIGRVSQKFWDSLNRKLQIARFKTAPIRTYESCKDCPISKLAVKWSNHERIFLRAWNIADDDPLLKMAIMLDSSYKFVALKPVDSSFKFEMKYPFPAVKIQDVKFPPPEPNRKKQ